MTKYTIDEIFTAALIYLVDDIFRAIVTPQPLKGQTLSLMGYIIEHHYQHNEKDKLLPDDLCNQVEDFLEKNFNEMVITQEREKNNQLN